MKYSPGISNFLLKISVFPILLFSSISLHWSLRKAFLSLLTILWNSAFNWVSLSFSLLLSLLFFSQLFVRSPQIVILLFCLSFSWGRSWFLFPVQCHEPPSIVHQALHLVKAMVFPVVIFGCESWTHSESKERWSPKNWCFWTVVLKTLKSPLACKKIQSVYPKWDHS